MAGGAILAAPGEELGGLLSLFFFLLDALEAGVDLPEAGDKGSFLLPGPPSEPEAPFSLGDLVPLVGAEIGGGGPAFCCWSLAAAASGSSTTRSWSLRSPSLPPPSSFFNFLDSGDLRLLSPGEIDVLCK